MKKLIPAFVLSFVISFMLFIYEPVLMYANNIDDFNFDLYCMIKPTLLISSGIFVILFSIFVLVFLINKIFFKKFYMYYGVLMIAFVGFICLYIQGNYLIGGLPPLDGSEMVWSGYTLQNVISIGILIILSGISIFSVIKFKIKDVIKVEMYLTLAVFLMLSTSFISTLLTTKALDKKENAMYYSFNNINNISSNKNFFILVVDAVDSVMFNDVLEKSEKYSNTFEDFTYYPDTLAAYPYTRDSIPFILSGTWNNNDKFFNTYSNEAYNKSVLFERLEKEKYDINLYDSGILWNGKINKKIVNGLKLEKINTIEFLKQELKYVSFKYFPYFLKKYSSIQSINFNINGVNGYDCSYGSNLRELDKDVSIQDNNYFQFLHVEGAHGPYNYDDDLNYISNGGTYEQKLNATLKYVNMYLNRIKESGQYDNSIIVVMSDHGYALDRGAVGRQNPVLFVKGINEKHKFIKSDLPISYEDLNDMYMDLLDGKCSTDLFKNIDMNRKRRFLWYEYLKEYHMIEYYQTGKAWDEDTLIASGKEFNR